LIELASTQIQFKLIPMLSIIESGGKQYLVSKGDKIQVEKLVAKEGEIVTFDKVLFKDGTLGKPFIEGALVEAKVLKQGRAKKSTF